MQEKDFKKIGRPAKECMGCGEPLDLIERHPSALRDDIGDASEQDDESAREDYCPECWKSLRSEGYFSFWLARRKPRQAPLRLFRKRRNATLLEVFARGADAPNPDEALRLRQYILAHLLHRYQALDHVGERLGPDGRLRLLYDCPALEGRRFEVEERDPTDEQIEAVRAEIRRHLDRAGGVEVEE
jgi:hypothetical protein